MKKRMAFILITAFACLTIAACASEKSSSEESSASSTESSMSEDNSKEEQSVGDGDVTTGGWTNNQLSQAATLPEEVQDAFDKVTEEYTDSALTPVAYLGSQLVAGTNYEILCESTQDPEAGNPDLYVIVIYSDLDGNAEMTAMKEFDYVSIAEAGAETVAEPEGTTGGWTVNEDLKEVTEPEDALNAFNDAVAEYTGNNLTPVAYLGSQVVAGDNYAYLCESETVTEEPVKSLQVAIVYQDLNEKSEITSIGAIDLTSFAK